MPFTVSCPACSARFSLGDDLFRRKVAGNLVTVKCRHCSAEIAVDATEPSTMPSHEAPVPRRAPSPPRPKGAGVTKMGLGMPAPAAQLSATATPLGLNPLTTPTPGRQSATATPLGGRATATPLGLGARVKPPPAEDLSIWDSDETVQINAPTPAAPKLALPRAPHVPHPPQRVHPPQPAQLEEPELIEAEEIPASSSDAPTLDVLTLETGRAKPSPGKAKPDDFLVNLSAGTQGILGSAPTIDVSHLDAPPESIDVDVIEDEEVEFHAAPNTTRTGTIPLFDMSAVLPAANDALKTGANAAAARTETAKPVVSSVVPAPESKARERKYVVAPKESPSAPKARRSGAAIWFVLVAAAAGVLAIVGLRGHGPAPVATTEPSASSEPAPVPVATEATPSAAAIPSAEASATSAESAALPSASSAPSTAPVPASPAVALATNTLPTPTATHESVAAEPAARPAVTAEPAVEKPEVEKPAPAPSKPVEAHNAPPPAADGTEFDRAAARSALASAAAQASACRKDGDPSGTATITITFAPSGRITSANLQGPPFAGTATGGCIANTMRHATVPAFSGERVTVTKNIVVQ